MKVLVFVPGIMGSVLVNGAGRVWPPTVLEAIFGYDRVDDLLGDDVRATEPIRRVGPMGVYRSLLDDIQACGYRQESDEKRLISFPYDWRRSNQVSAIALADRLDQELAGASEDLEITLLAHSMGGLVCRFLLESGDFIDRAWFSNIRRLITLGTPQVGAPLALHRLSGRAKAVGLSGADIKKIGNDPRYPSTFELVPTFASALTTQSPSRAELPKATDPFGDEIVQRLGMNRENVAAARSFWSRLDLAGRPVDVDYFFVVGSAMKTLVGNSWSGPAQDPDALEEKTSGDGTVPIASSTLPGIPHLFSRKKHATIFADRKVRKFLYRVLEAPEDVHPQAAGDVATVGVAEAMGLSVDQEVYDPNDEIEVVISFNKEVTDPRENFELVKIDPQSGDRDQNVDSVFINARFRGITLSVFSFTIKQKLAPGFYELRCGRELDDPEPTQFYVRDGGQ